MTLKQFASCIIYFLPKFIAVPLKKKYQRRQLRLLKERYRRTRVTKEDIVSIFDKLNIDCDIFLHSSTLSIGKIAIGTKDIAELILEKVNISKNTLLASALPFRGRFKDYLEKGCVFDVRNAPVEMGSINEYLSMHPNVLRSLHPTHSVIAIGPKAEYYTSEHHFDITPFGMHSPYYKLLANSAKILMFGAGLNYFTFAHVIEDILGSYFPVNPYLKKVYTVEVIDSLGKTFIVQTRCHDPLKAVKRDGYPILPYYVKYNAIERHPIGESETLLLDAKRSLYAYYMALLDGISIYGKFHLRNETRIKILEQLESLNST
jgi:aminoglycoside 3-N-acetyltransferase